MDKGHTVLEFTKVQFIGEWNRQIIGTNSIYYPGDSNKKGMLYVVWQSETGSEKTYEFVVPFKDPHDPGDHNQVWIHWAENIIHVPALCLKSGTKDTTKCRG